MSRIGDIIETLQNEDPEAYLYAKIDGHVYEVYDGIIESDLVDAENDPAAVLELIRCTGDRRLRPASVSVEIPQSLVLAFLDEADHRWVDLWAILRQAVGD